MCGWRLVLCTSLSHFISPNKRGSSHELLGYPTVKALLPPSLSWKGTQSTGLFSSICGIENEMSPPSFIIAPFTNDGLWFVFLLVLTLETLNRKVAWLFQTKADKRNKNSFLSFTWAFQADGKGKNVFVISTTTTLCNCGWGWNAV